MDAWNRAGKARGSRVRTVFATEVLIIAGLLSLVGRAYGVQEIFGLDDPVHLSVPVASGSGTILTHDGWVLTNVHVISDTKKRLFDFFMIGITDKFDQKPIPKCLGVPRHAVLKPELDLALIKCEVDLEGRPFSTNSWPAASVGSSEDLVPGDEIIVIGYPSLGGATITYTSGKVSGFMNAKGGAGRFWMKTDAEFSPGNSGGTALDENGRLIGVPTAGKYSKVGQGKVGLVRPIELARDLLKHANIDWMRGGGRMRDSPQPPQPADGVTIIGTVKAVANGKPIAGAMVMILKPGARVADLNDDNAKHSILVRGRSDANGRFSMPAPVRRGGQYGVLVAAKGYQLLSGDAVLSVDQDAPDPYDPWGVLRLDSK